jgi:cytochrome c553
VLRELPVAARVVLATFLFSVGIGYGSALVQLHFQHASPGSFLPTAKDAENVFHGPTGKPVSTMERLLTAPETGKFNGTGQMSAAFTIRSGSWEKDKKEKAKQLFGRRGGDLTAEQLNQAEQALRQERENERQAFLSWIRAGASKAEYDSDRYCLPDEMAGQPLNQDVLAKGGDGKPLTPRALAVKSLIEARCARCHAKEGDDANAAQYPLDSYAAIQRYTQVKATSAMSVTKLAQTTHVHLLGFSMLYGLTGLLFALTSYPALWRLLLGPFVLVAQVVDIGCWWLARLDPLYAHLIVFTGAAVASGLIVQIILTLFNLFGRYGKIVILGLILAGAVGAYVLDEKYVTPALEAERSGKAAVE